ncbi:BglG family transcription antiterminator [Alloiococcus sp. CFN-8]|uniref:BglG family transcription antiterminator n=1 Tax=Alloiococcus sp. CFN-8 TaxID=3416081 RepID=UPI003CF0FBD5
MNDSMRELLSLLIRKEKFFTIKELSSLYSLSTRTIYNSLNSIDSFLEDINMRPLERVKGKGIRYKLELEEKKTLMDILFSKSYAYLSPEERRNQIIIKLTESHGYFLVEDFANMLQVSRNTVINDINIAKEWVSSYGVKIKTYPYKGITLEGQEENIRRALFKLISETELKLGSSNMFLSRILANEEAMALEEFVSVLEKNLNTNFSDISYLSIMLSFSIAIKRIRIGSYVNRSEEAEAIVETREFKILQGLKEYFIDTFSIELPYEELIYLSQQITGSSIQSYDKVNNIFENWIQLQIVLRNFIIAVEIEQGIDISLDRELFLGMLQHLRSTLYRLNNNMVLENPIENQIIEQFSKLHKSVVRNISIIEKSFSVLFTSSEISFLTMHFAAAIERRRKRRRKVPRVAVVCSSGISTSQILLAQLKSRFQINVVGAYSSRNIIKVINEEIIDLIITTIDLQHHGVNIIKVNPILSVEDINRLNIVLDNIVAQFNIHTLINIFKKNGTINNEIKLKEELIRYLQPQEVEAQRVEKPERRIEPMLIEVLNEDLISVMEEVETREEAIIKSGQLLYKNGLIEERYIQAMLDNLKDNGTYIVIAPGIAMPHARPELGAKDIGISLMTLKKPVKFGHKSNDPVSLVIGLCAVDHQTHLLALSELMGILGDEASIARILKATSSEEIMEIIKEERENG